MPVGIKLSNSKQQGSLLGQKVLQMQLHCCVICTVFSLGKFINSSASVPTAVDAFTEGLSPTPSIPYSTANSRWYYNI